MPSIFLEQPVSDTEIQAGLHAANYNDLQTLLNGGLDAANFVGTPTLSAGQTLVWNGSAFVAGATVPTGTGAIWYTTTAPATWLLCDGSAVSRTGANAALFGVMGTTYGVGDGSTTFNLPDLRGRMPTGLGTHADVDALNDNDGIAVGTRRPKHAHSHTLATGNDTPDHVHNPLIASGTVGGGLVPRAVAGTSDPPFASANNTAGASARHTHPITGGIGIAGMTDSAGYVVVNFIVKL